jgi:hypothetical protein
MIGRYRGLAEVSHTGSTAGYRAFLARYPQQKTGVSVLCNIGSVNPGSVGHGVADLFLSGAIAALGAAPTAGAVVAARDGRAGRAGRAGGAGGGRQGGGRGGAAQYQPSAAELRELVGDYYSPDAETTFNVVIERDGLYIRRRPDSRLTLNPVEKDVFSGGGFQSVRFVRDSANRVIQISVRQDRVFDLRFDRVGAGGR